MAAPGDTVTIAVDLTGLNTGSSVQSTAVSNQVIESVAVITGPKGDTGATGSTGPAGIGVPTGGTTGQVLLKESNTNYDFTWDDFPPALVTNTFVVASQAAMLALAADQGDVAVRTDLNSNFILRGTNPATLSDWQELLGGVGNVSSVNGYTGNVTLVKADVGLGNVDNTSDTTKNAASVTLTNKTISGSTNTLSNIPESAVTSLVSDLAAKAIDSAVVHNTGGETIAGSKTFSSTIGGSISGNAATVTTNANLTGDVTSSGNATTLANTANVKSVVQTNRLDQMAIPTASVSMNSQKITSLLDPTSAQDAATKAYADAVATGLFIKAPVRVASTANVTISAPGTTIDGVTLTSGDRVLLKDQTTARDNGIWVFATSSSTMTRATDADTSTEVKAGTYVFVDEGTANADTSWVLTTNDPITLGTTSLTFVNFSSVSLPDATTTIKGKLQLAGDFGGTASLPKIKRTSRFIIAPYGDTRPADYTCAGASNNNVEINAAMAAAAVLPNGGTVELLDGTFVTSASIMRLPNVHVRGQGIGHTKITPVSGGNFNIFDMDKVTYDDTNPLYNSQLSEMEIDGSNFDPASAVKCVNGGNYKYSRLYRIYAHNATATGIGDDDFYGTIIDQCIAENNGYTNKRVITAASWSGSIFTYTTSTAHGYAASAQATGLLTASGTISDGDTVTIDQFVYTFKTILTGVAYEVLINGSTANALTNLKRAISLTGTIGTDYGTGTLKHPSVTAGTTTSTTQPITASNYGTTGNNIVTTETGANLAWGAATLTGGVTGNKITITGMAPANYNGLYNITTTPTSTTFTLSSANNSGNLNFGVDPGVATTFGLSSDTLIGHNGIGIASGALDSEACLVSNCVAIGNQDNNFLIEADSNNSGNACSYIFTNCISFNAGNAGFANTGSINAFFDNCYDYGSYIGATASVVGQNRTVSNVVWSAGVATVTTIVDHLYSVGETVTLTGMLPTTYNGVFQVQSVPTTNSYTITMASDPGTLVYKGSSARTVHPVEGSIFSNMVLSNNNAWGVRLTSVSDGITLDNVTIRDSLNYGMQTNSSFSQFKNMRIYGCGRIGLNLAAGGGDIYPMQHISVSGQFFNNGKHYANQDGVVLAGSSSVPIQDVTLDIQAYDTQATQTQRYGLTLSSAGTLTNISISGDLTGNATGAFLNSNTSSTIYVNNVLGVNPNGKSDLGNVTGSTTFDSSTANFFTATLTGNITAVMPNTTVGGSRMTWVLTQDATGSRTLTLPANAVAATTLTLSTTAAKVDVINWAYDKSTSKWREVSRALGTAAPLGTLNNLVITTPNSNNTVSLAVTQNDTTNNPDATDITNAGTSHGLKILQTGIQATNKYALFVDSSSGVIQSNAPLARIRQQNTSSTTDALQLDNLGTGNALLIATGNLSMAGATNISLATTTGTKIGTGTTQKLGFYNATPIVQPTGDILTALSNLGLVASPTITVPDITYTVVSKTANYTLTSTDNLVLGDTSSGGFTLTLPTAVSISGRTYMLKKTATANTLTIATTSSQTIDGSTTFGITAQYETLMVMSDGSNWQVI